MHPTSITLDRPLTRAELHDFTNGGATAIEAFIRIDLVDLIREDMEWLNDTANERILGPDHTAGMSDFSYSAAWAERADSTQSWGAGTVTLHVRAIVMDELEETE